MFKENQGNRIENSTKTDVFLIALIVLLILAFVSGIFTYWRDSQILHAQNERSIQNRHDIEIEQMTSKQERRELRDRLIRLEQKVEMLSK